MVKNYTSLVDVSKSVQHIESRLVKQGAKNIFKHYNDKKKLEGIAFIIAVDGKDVPYRMPAKVDQVERILRTAITRPRPETMKRVADQAERTAWKLVSDWVEINLSLIELGQAEFMEVFLPYVYDHGKNQTFFESMKQDGFKLLENQSQGVAQ